ncbi:sarcosine oxidase subunit alpha family protein [Ruegeria sp. Ofav3-42]|uniref:sarcosine oxidase subunit alpha family protein n=1 Tax=Ruegeria sp. Ofav3-42 TaxID=2917759 RepID=UPI001EF45FD3|nr:sarcosine oxidase subunit alpha family protein [Ruegeria sp. Ofav3-42]MCG7522529.1 sarcosine oxidase subunit alpha family protein [Ruegeria sp. Ofav3-42]
MKRLPTGGRIDRTAPLKVRFDSQDLPAFQGDTLSSAMLAGGVSLVGRSFKYHRPRGIYSAGVEEPGAIVHLRDGNRHEPNARATVTEAFDGLTATSQNAWPSLGFDIGAVNNWLSPFFSAGFYYKTFIGPFKHSTKFWMTCETFIRKAAGMGRATYLDDPDHYEKCNAFCDVLVIGGGVAGLSAALAAGRAGAQVMLVEQDVDLGGAVLSDPVSSDGDSWVASALSELEALNNVRILTRTTAFGAYDGDAYGLIERVSDHIKAPENHQVRQRYWLVHAKRAVMATGAIERPLVFGGNDLPGVMLAGATRTYLNRYAVLAAENVVVATNNDSAYQVATDLARAGAQVLLADMRPDPSEEVVKLAQQADVTVMPAHGVIQARGGKKVTYAMLVPVDVTGRAQGSPQKFEADLIAVSGGWTPVVHLWSQRYGKPVYQEDSACFVPDAQEGQTLQGAGTAAAAESLADVIAQGFARGAEAATAVGHPDSVGIIPDAFATGPFWQQGLHPAWAVLTPQGKTQGKAFVDFQHDVKISDIDQAHLEGYVSVEHLKRYTTLGMATDQGKLANVNALSRMAELRGKDIPEVGTTTFRPPFTPISVGAIVGHEHGRHFRPTRLSPIHHWHVENGAKMTEAGAWIRPWYYPQGTEDLTAAYIREATHVREHVGMVDVSTLGKIAVQGPDAAEFLNRIYVNGWKTLAVGRLRYGVMLREDGFVMDDGATARLGEHDYFMSTTTANAAKVLAFAEHLLQTAWKDLRVHVTTVTDQWAAIAVAGSKARALLTQVSDADLSRETLPNNHWTTARIGDVDIRIHRMSYSGELAYELYIPAGFGRHVWETLYAAGSEFDLRPYGTESMGALRIEKGHVAGPELEGRTTMKDLGLEGFASSKKPFVGSVLRKREVLEDPARPTLVGLEVEGDTGAKPGSLLFSLAGEAKGHGDGWVSSTTYSPALGKNIAMGLLKNGKDRKGEVIRIVNFVGDQTLKAKVVSHHFFDPEGERQNG